MPAATHTPPTNAQSPPAAIIGLEPRRLDARAISDPNESVRAACLGTVLTRPELATSLRAPIAARLADEAESEDNRILAAYALAKVKPLPTADLIVGLARSQGPKVRTAAASALIAPKGEAAAASAALAKCLLAGDAFVRGQSVFALRGIGGEAVPSIIEIIVASEQFDITRMSGMDALGFIGGEAEAALPLAERLSNNAPPAVMVCARFAVASVRCAGVKAGGGGDATRAKFVRPLLDMVEHPEPKVRLLAIERLGWLKDGAPSACETFVRLLERGTTAEREAAALGLARSRTPTESALDPLMRAINDPEPTVRKAACIALTAYGTDATPALQPMLTLAKDTTQPEEVRRSAGECAKAVVKATKGAYWT